MRKKRVVTACCSAVDNCMTTEDRNKMLIIKYPATCILFLWLVRIDHQSGYNQTTAE